MIIFPEDNLINYVNISNDFVASHEFLNREIGEFDRVQPLSEDMTVREYRQRQESNRVAMNNNIIFEGLRKRFLIEEQEEHDWKEALKIELLPCPCCGGKARFVDAEDMLPKEVIRTGSSGEDVYSYTLARVEDLMLRDLLFHAVISSNFFYATSRGRGIFCEQCHAYLPANFYISLNDVWFGIFEDEPQNWQRYEYRGTLNRICASLWNSRGNFKSKLRPSSDDIDYDSYFVFNRNTKPCPICGCTVCNEKTFGVTLMEFMQCTSCGFETVGIDNHRITYEESNKISHKELKRLLNMQRNCELTDKNNFKKFKEYMETMYSELRRIHHYGR